MDLFQVIIYGLVQGLGEFLPISSSAHLIIVPWAAGWQDPGLAFDVALHLGTLLAVVLYFRRDIVRLGRAFGASLVERRLGNDPDRRLVWLIIAGSIPGGLAGFALEHAAEGAFRAKWLIALAMIVMGMVLWAADRQVARCRNLAELTWRQALLIGLAQAVAIIPGVSRSGSTIAAGRGLGLDRQAAARFSFLLAIPIIAGAGLLKVPKLIHAGGMDWQVAVGLLVAAISGYLAISVLLRFVRTRSYLPFVVYRLAFGLAVLAALWTGLRPG